ncbi:hypothetical protein QBC40DRAFT_311930 [Triangularia verruculosa]|uniref:RGS domain-containing protein n=1 Tax=Triangularia verruculosa TaxID=2587418 RepID=A0AAN7AZT9_9PEZI|nr:hypothetical protein QBC40DRAFT_311930 [Triangularia verruculosa]
MTRSRLRPHSPTLLSPVQSPKELTPRPSAVSQDGDGDSIMSTSRPSSVALMPPSAPANATSPPSLRDILTDVALPPYTLSAFTAFLSQNHCLETLEFTLQAERYRTAYANIVGTGERPPSIGDGSEHICLLWQKLMHTFIQPCGTREVNLPARVRDRLLSLPCVPIPPNPSELDEAVKIVYELMNDSVLGPFLESVAPHEEQTHHHHDHDPRLFRSRLRIPRETSSSSADESIKSPKSAFLPMLNLAWSSEPKSSASSSSDPMEHAGLSDDSGNAPSPPANEPMTPPTTPPTSDWAFANTSPGSLQRAISAHNSGWKKMGAKLGLGRRGRTKRDQPTSGGETEVVPIPQDPATSSHLHVPADKTMTGFDEKVRSITSTPRSSAEWEEPHPGKRFPVPAPGNVSQGVGIPQQCSGVHKNGTAAKGFVPYPTRGWNMGTRRRFLRPRVRVKIPANSQDNPIKSNMCCRPQSTTSSAAPMISPATSPTVPLMDRVASPVYGCETDMGTIRLKDGSMESTLDGTLSSKHSSTRRSMTDFSNFLSPAPTDESDDSSCMSFEPDLSPSLSPDEDPYGWEAELSKKAAVPDAMACCSSLEYRRAHGGKRSLLQKVLSLGPREFGRPSVH